jgi:hypothetical protein
MEIMERRAFYSLKADTALREMIREWEWLYPQMKHYKGY